MGVTGGARVQGKECLYIQIFQPFTGALLKVPQNCENFEIQGIHLRPDNIII